MPPDTLAAYGLQSGDSGASDHLPDLYRSPHASPSESTDTEPKSGALRLLVAPNPAVSGVSLSANLPAPAEILVEVCDAAGPPGRIPARNELGASWGGSMVARLERPGRRRTSPGAGTYFVRLRVRDARGEAVDTRKWSILR